MRQLSRVWLTAAALSGLAASARGDAFDEEPTAGSLVRLFNDSQRVRVSSLMGETAIPLPSETGLTLHWNYERVTIPGIDAPAGSQEAIDAITTASRPISGNAYEDYHKLRNEVTGEVVKGPAALGYYVSTEPDFLGQQIAARYDKSFRDEALNLSFGTSYGWDAIEPLADDDTQTPADTRGTLHWNAVATRILSPSTLLRVGVEYNLVNGLQHNPYRNVYAGGSIVPERHPDHRQRRDAFLKLNHALRDRASVKFSYRFYDDDWGIGSHELGSKLSQYVTRGVFARYEYRYYTQSAADFYRAEYASVDGIDGYRTADYRMGPLSSHLFGFGLEVDLAPLLANMPVFGRLRANFGYQRYFNSNNYSADILETGIETRF